jgi:hypothetical protein
MSVPVFGRYDQACPFMLSKFVLAASQRTLGQTLVHNSFTLLLGGSVDHVASNFGGKFDRRSRTLSGPLVAEPRVASMS